MRKNNIISGDDFKSTKSIERKKKKRLNDDEQDNIETIGNNELIPLTEENIESYFGDENYVKKLADEENSKKQTLNEEGINQINSNSKIRLFCYRIVTHSKFELFMTLLIVANSVLTALSDYNYVDNNNNLLNTTLRNSGQLSAEPVFLSCFLLEMILKMIAFGFMGPGNYFADGWNLLDGFVVIIGLLSLLPAVPNLNVVRTFRCFRSIKLTAVSPALKNIMSNIMQSIFNLGDVLLMLFLTMLVFSIIGMHLFSGPYTHTRCRLTPYPVNTSWSLGLDFKEYRCLNVDNYNLLADQPSWTKETSPWHTPQSNCFWPIDNTQRNFCSLGDSGVHQCDHADSIPDVSKRFCGSNYDARGNARFVGAFLLKSETYIPELSYGFANYDNIVRSFITVFQIATLNGWSGFMYQMQDSLDRASSIFFIVTFMICNYLIINLVLAIWNTTSNSTKKEKKLHGSRYKFYLRYHHYLLMKEEGKVSEEYKTNLDGSPWPDNSTYYRIMTLYSKTCFKIILTTWYKIIVEGAILMNAAVLMADYYPAPLFYLWRLEVLNFILTIIFVIETMVKILGLGLGRYMESKLRLMDCFVTFLCIFSSIENLPFLFGYQIPNELHFETKINAFRALRILRILGVMHAYPILTDLIKKVLKAVRSTMAFAVIINLFIYTMALIGMTFFANRLVFDENGYVINDINSQTFLDAKKRMPRSNFDNFLFSFASVFQIMTTEAWNSIQNDLWRSRGMVAILYPWVILVFGVFILLSLYIGQVIDDFANETSVEHDHRQEAHDIDEIIDEEASEPADEEKFYEANNDCIEKIDDIEKGITGTVVSEPIKISWFQVLKNRLDMQSDKNPFYVTATNPLFDKAVLSVIILSAIALALDDPLANPEFTSSKTYNNIGNACTLFFLCEAILKIVGFGPLVYLSDGWNIFDFCITVVSMFFLYYEDPRLNSLRSFRVFRVLRPLRLLSQFPGLKLVVNSLICSIQEAGYISLLLLIVWLIFGTVAVSYKKGQMRSCVGDVFTNTISTNQAYYRTLQHPMPWNQMTIDQKEMFGPDSKVYFGNSTFASSCTGWPGAPCCQGIQFPVNAKALTSRQLCECWGGTWDFVSGVSFDNIGTALIALFSIATTEGWVTLMYNVVDSNGIDMEPIRNNNVEWIVAVLFFMMVGSFLALNIFVGVVVDAYTKSYKELNASPLDSMMTPEQQEWVRETESRSIIDDNYKEEKTSITQKGLNETAWSRIVILSIVVNTILLAIKFFGEPTKLSVTINSIRLTISVLFMVEMLHILITKGYKMYFREFINVVDCFLVIINFAGCIKSYFVTSSGNFYFVSIFRVLVAINVLINMYPVYFQTLKTFVRTILKTIPAFCNIGTLVVLFLFIWSLIGVNTYAKVQFYGTHNQYANFRNLNTAFTTIIRFMTGEGWSQFMYDLSREQPGCVSDPPYDETMCGFNDFYGCIPMNGCGHVSVFPFFFCFQIFVAYITLNLTVAVILENYLSLAHTRKATINHVVRLFVAGWLNYDSNKKCYLNYSELERFAIDSDCNPYSFPPELPLSKVRDRLIKMQIRCFLGKGCYLSDVLAGFQKDYAENHKDDPVKDSNLNVISIAESAHFNLDTGPGQTNNFLRSYYFNKNLSKELNISLALLTLKKNKKLSIIKGIQIAENFETNFYISRSFFLWKYGPAYNDDILWPKSAKKYEETTLFVLPYTRAIMGGVEVIGGGVGILGSWFTSSHDNQETSNNYNYNNQTEPVQELIIPEVVEVPVKKKTKKKKIIKPTTTTVSEAESGVPEDSGDERTNTKKAVKPQTKKKLKKKDPPKEEQSP